MEAVTLNERVNLEAVKYLMSMPKSRWKSELSTDKDRKFEVEYKKATDYLKGQLDGTGITRTYKFADGKHFGRQFDHSGLQGMQKCIRGILCDGVISDLDIVNCHPNILSYICRQNDIPCPNLDYYIKNRDKILNLLQHEHNYDREDAKKRFLKSTNSSYPHKRHDYDFLDAYDAEMKKIQKQIVEVKEYNFIKPKVKKGDNEEGSFINLCLCYHENKILMKAYDFLASKKVEICTLSFDGLMHYGAEDTKLLNELNAYISNEYIDAGFKFVYKPHSKSIRVPKDFDSSSVPNKSYKMMCKWFNKSHAKVGGKYICEDVAGEKEIELEAAFKARYKHYRVYDREDQFIDAWLKNIPNTNMRTYLKFGMHPDNLCPEDVYNLWEPFVYSLKTVEYEPDTQGLSKILHLVKVLANYDDFSEKFLLDWMAQMLQYPEIKPGAMPVIQSKPGAGKNSLIDILTRILGKNKVWECVDPQRDIFGSHNGKMRDAFLINVNEAGIKDFSGALGKLKSLVTEPFVSIRAMYQDVTILPSYHRLILTTNETYAIGTEAGDRRLGIIAASNDLVIDPQNDNGNKEWWKSFREDVLDSERALRTFYDYLMKRPTKKVFTAEDLPLTEYAQQLQGLSVHPIVQWLEDIATVKRQDWKNKGYYNDNILTLHANLTWDDYRAFCLVKNINLDKTPENSFATQLGIRSKDIPGVDCARVKKQRVKRFDLKQMRDHFRVTDVVDELLIDDDPE